MGYQALALALLLLTSVLGSATINAPAVGEGGGAILPINVEVVSNGTGKAYISSYPAHDQMFMSSAQLALYTAAEVAGVYTANFDVLITPEFYVEEFGGPSASAYIAVAIASILLNVTLDSNASMTGMVMPLWFIGPVGGVDAKLKAVADAGMKKFLIPQVSNYEEYVLTGEKLGVKVVPVLTVDEALYHMTGVTIKVHTQNVEVPEEFNELFKETYLELKKLVSQYMNNENVSRLVQEADNYYKQGMYYIASSLAYRALYTGVYNDLMMGRARPSELKLIARNIIDRIKFEVSGIKPTYENFEKLLIVYERVYIAEKLLNSTLQYYSTIALAYVRAKTLEIMVKHMKLSSDGEPLSVERLERVLNIYFGKLSTIVTFVSGVNLETCLSLIGWAVNVGTPSALMYALAATLCEYSDAGGAFLAKYLSLLEANNRDLVYRAYNTVLLQVSRCFSSNITVTMPILLARYAVKVYGNDLATAMPLLLEAYEYATIQLYLHSVSEVSVYHVGVPQTTQTTEVFRIDPLYVLMATLVATIAVVEATFIYLIAREQRRLT